MIPENQAPLLNDETRYEEKTLTTEDVKIYDDLIIAADNTLSKSVNTNDSNIFEELPLFIEEESNAPYQAFEDKEEKKERALGSHRISTKTNHTESEDETDSQYGYLDELIEQGLLPSDNMPKEPCYVLFLKLVQLGLLGVFSNDTSISWLDDYRVKYGVSLALGTAVSINNVFLMSDVKKNSNTKSLKKWIVCDELLTVGALICFCSDNNDLQNLVPWIFLADFVDNIHINQVLYEQSLKIAFRREQAILVLFGACLIFSFILDDKSYSDLGQLATAGAAVLLRLWDLFAHRIQCCFNADKYFSENGCRRMPDYAYFDEEAQEDDRIKIYNRLLT